MNEEIDFEEAAPWLVVFITFIGGVLRIILLDHKGFWLDETFSVWMANQNVADTLQWIVKIDQHPPLYYLLLHYWIGHYGDTPYYARLFSVLFGTGTIPIIYLIGKRISGTVVGLIAALFFSLSPFNVYYAQEARMYTLLTFNAAMAIYALVWLLTDSRSIRPIGSQFRKYLHTWRETGTDQLPVDERDLSYMVETPRTGLRAWISRHHWSPIQTVQTDLAWVTFILFSAATMYTHNTAVFFPLATNIFVLGLMLYQRIKKSGSPPAFQAPSFGNWVKAQIGIFLLWIPWIGDFIKQASRVYEEFWIPQPNWDTITQTFQTLLNASAPGRISQVMTWILCAVLILGLVHYRKKLSIFLFLATLFIVPFLGELIVSLRRPIFYDRTLIWITIPLLVVLAAGIAQLRYRYLMGLVLVVLAINYFFSTSDYFRFWRKEDWSTPAGYVANFAEKDDLILFNSNFVVIPFEYFFREYEHLYRIQVIKQGVPLDLFDDGILEPKMTKGDIPDLISLISEHNRVWLVYSHNDYTDPMGLIPQTLESNMELSRQRDFYGGQVQLYVAPP